MDSILFELLELTQDIGLRETLENKIRHLKKWYKCKMFY